MPKDPYLEKLLEKLQAHWNAEGEQTREVVICVQHFFESGQIYELIDALDKKIIDEHDKCYKHFQRRKGSMTEAVRIELISKMKFWNELRDKTKEVVMAWHGY